MGGPGISRVNSGGPVVMSLLGVDVKYARTLFMRLITNRTLEIKGPPLTCSLHQVAERARGEGRQASGASLIIWCVCVREHVLRWLTGTTCFEESIVFPSVGPDRDWRR